REARRGLAASRLADQPECLALVEREAHAIHCLHDAGPAEGEEVRLEIGHLQDRGHANEARLTDSSAEGRAEPGANRRRAGSRERPGGYRRRGTPSATTGRPSRSGAPPRA